MNPRFEIIGRAGHEETAAVAAVIAALIEEEANVLATPPRAPRQSSWVLAWRPRDVPTPLPSHTFNARPWSDVEPDEDGQDSLS